MGEVLQLGAVGTHTKGDCLVQQLRDQANLGVRRSPYVHKNTIPNYNLPQNCSQVQYAHLVNSTYQSGVPGFNNIKPACQELYGMKIFKFHLK